MVIIVIMSARVITCLLSQCKQTENLGHQFNIRELYQKPASLQSNFLSLLSVLTIGNDII